MSSAKLTEIAAGVAEGGASVLEGQEGKVARYASDPMVALEEGRIMVWDRWRREIVPLEPWPNQVELLKAWITPEFLAGTGPLGNVHCEKSRRQGDTWLLSYASLWLVTYHDVKLLMAHKRLDEVSDGTLDSFWGKIEFIWQRWPEEIGKIGLRFTGGIKPMITQPDRDRLGFIAGTSGKQPDPGRGGDYEGAVLDEAARFQFDQKMVQALELACPDGQVWLSTPNGEDNRFFRMRKARAAGWKFLRHHWSGHPIYSKGLHVAGERKTGCKRCNGTRRGEEWTPRSQTAHRYPGKLTSPWFDDAIVNMLDEEVAAELEIDYTASLAARVFPGFSDEQHVAKEPIRWDYAPILLGWDFGIGAPTVVVVCQEFPTEFRVLGSLELADSPPETIILGLRELLIGLGVPKALLDDRTVRQEMITSIGDPSGVSKDISSAISPFEAYARLGWPIRSRRTLPQEAIDAVNRLLMGHPKPLVISPADDEFVRHVKSWRWETDALGKRKPGPPRHDEHSHACTAFYYLVHWLWPKVEGERRPRSAMPAGTSGWDEPGEDRSGRLGEIRFGMDY